MAYCYLWQMPVTPPLPPLFTECQSMLRHWWGLALLAPAIILGVALGVDARHGALETAGMGALATVISCLTMSFLKLHTQLAADGVRVRFAPVQSAWRLTPWTQVRQAYLRTYAPMREYGGWGICTFGGESEAYSAGGTQGLQLILASGERLLIGTQQPAAIQQVLSQLRIRGSQREVED